MVHVIVCKEPSCVAEPVGVRVENDVFRFMFVVTSGSVKVVNPIGIIVIKWTLKRNTLTARHRRCPPLAGEGGCGVSLLLDPLDIHSPGVGVDVACGLRARAELLDPPALLSAQSDLQVVLVTRAGKLGLLRR